MQCLLFFCFFMVSVSSKQTFHCPGPNKLCQPCTSQNEPNCFTSAAECLVSSDCAGVHDPVVNTPKFANTAKFQLQKSPNDQSPTVGRFKCSRISKKCEPCTIFRDADCRFDSKVACFVDSDCMDIVDRQPVIVQTPGGIGQPRSGGSFARKGLFICEPHVNKCRQCGPDEFCPRGWTTAAQCLEESGKCDQIDGSPIVVVAKGFSCQRGFCGACAADDCPEGGTYITMEECQRQTKCTRPDEPPTGKQYYCNSYTGKCDLCPYDLCPQRVFSWLKDCRTYCE